MNEPLTARRVRMFMRMTGGILKRIKRDCPNISIDIPYVLANIFFDGMPNKPNIEYCKMVLEKGESYFK